MSALDYFPLGLPGTDILSAPRGPEKYDPARSKLPGGHKALRSAPLHVTTPVHGRGADVAPQTPYGMVGGPEQAHVDLVHRGQDTADLVALDAPDHLSDLLEGTPGKQ